MSIYGHYAQQYYGNKVSFPKESFLVAGISFNQDNCEDINYDDELNMVHEPTNKYDETAISIINNGKLIGYVPANPDYYKKLCSENITEPLKIINIKKIEGIYGIRVIPKCFYTKKYL
jgi:hypothetical protein